MEKKTKDKINNEIKELKEGVKDEISDFFCWDFFSGMGWFGVVLYIIFLPIILVWIVIRTIFRLILP